MPTFHPARSLRLLVAVVVAVVVGVLGVVPAAHAASHNGLLLVKGPGSLYTGADQASLATSPGVAARFSIKVVNSGTALAQYKLLILPSPGLTAVATTGSLGITPLTGTSDGYYTAPIAPGKSQIISLKLTPPASSAQQRYVADVELHATDGTLINYSYLYTEVKAPKVGTGTHDLFVHNGSQPNVGGTVNNQMATAPSLKVGQTATFKVRLSNDGSTSHQIGLGMSIPPACSSYFATKLTLGTTEVTVAALSGSYATPILAPGAHQDLVLSVKYVTTVPSSCLGGLWNVWSKTVSNAFPLTDVQLAVNTAA